MLHVDIGHVYVSTRMYVGQGACVRKSNSVCGVYGRTFRRCDSLSVRPRLADMIRALPFRTSSLNDFKLAKTTASIS
jgi:hypothetical protein